MTLEQDLQTLSPEMRARLAARGFDPASLIERAKTIGKDRDRRNRLKGRVEPPPPSLIVDAPVPGTNEHARLAKVGTAALQRGEVALCVLAGGMATRMGGVVKALVEALPGRTFLDLRLAEQAHLERVSGGRLPLWLMTSEATDGPIRAALGSRADGEHIATFEQFVSLRLTPEGRLFRGADGEPDAYATGHGDLPDALRASGLLDRFLRAGGRTVWIANLDNLGATVDPAILGWHLEHGAPCSVEVVDKVGADRGGGPVLHDGRPIITEEFRLPIGFDPATVPVFNTNTFLVSAQALAQLELSWTWVEVEKKISRERSERRGEAEGRAKDQIGDAKAIQFERLVGEITTALDTRLLRVPRDGTRSRFLPCKDVPELERRRPEIQAALTDRGILP